MLQQKYRSRFALLTSLSMMTALTVPLFSSVAHASLFRGTSSSNSLLSQSFQRRYPTVASGTVIPVRYDEAEKVVVTPDETTELTLTITQDLYSEAGTRLVSAGSQITGMLQPVDGGMQFISEEITFASGQSRPIDARSQVITDTEVITEESDPDILRGAAIGGAAAAVLAEVFGSIDFLEVLAGAGLGALTSVLLGGSDKEVEVVVVEPEQDLDLTLQSDFVLD